MKKTLFKSIFLVLSFVLLSINSYAQELNLNDPLPVNTKIKKGVLKNGMTYYIYSTDVTQNVASYYIIQNVGSILENDDQQGLAHFLEHMAFNGTENFPGKGILDTLQQYGAVFGKDINAYTSFDETVYNLDNIPTKDGLIDTSLMILHDWSNYLLLTDDEIDAERGVIKEEWRTRQSGQMRVFKQSLPVYFNNSLYAKRMPIGLMEIVEGFEYKALRDFYHDWYRTDLQAIAVVGDINVNEVEQKIIKIFSHIPAVENPKERFSVEIEDNDELLYSLAMDNEVKTSNIVFKINQPKSLENRTVADLKELLLQNMVITMLSARIKEKSQDPDAPFIGAFLNYGSLSRTKNQFRVFILPKTNQQAEAFKAVLSEINRAVKFGFTKAEIDRTVVQLKNLYETQISKISDTPHKKIIDDIKQNYLENETMTDLAKEYDIAKVVFENLDKAEVDNTLKEIYSKNNRAVLVTGVEGNKNLTKEEAEQIINSVENDENLTAYADAFSGKTLVSDETIETGEVVSELYNGAIGATTFILSNGIKVHYKFADKNKNEVKLSAVSYGGTSVLNDSLLPSSSLVGNLVQFSGLGNFSSTELPKVLAGKTVTTNIRVSSLTESISGSSATKDVETMLQMVYLRFENPRFDENSYKVLMGNVQNYLVRRSENINEKMSDSVTVTLYGKNHPTERLFDEKFVSEISFDKVKYIYLDRFKNASDFEFFIVGDIKEEALKPLLAKYIASIKTDNIKENWKDDSTSWVADNIDKDIYLKMEDPKSSVRIVYKNNIEYSLRNELLARALGDILQLRFTETLREQEGGTYGARVRSYITKRPIEEGYISVYFDCNPEKVEKLTEIVHQEIKKIAEGDINPVDLEKTLTNYLKERAQQKDYNSYDMNLLFNFYREGYNMNNPDTFENIAKSVGVKAIENYAKKMLENPKSYEIVFKPKM